MYIHKLTTMEGILTKEFNLLFHNTQNKKHATCCTTHTPSTLWEAIWEHEVDHSNTFWNCTKIRLHLESVNAVVNTFGYEIPNTCPVMYLSNIADVVMRKDFYLTEVLFVASKKALNSN